MTARKIADEYRYLIAISGVALFVVAMLWPKEMFYDVLCRIAALVALAGGIGIARLIWRQFKSDFELD